MSTGSARTATQDESRPPAADDGSEQPQFTIDAPSISLPKGGGAIKSIDEKLTVNPSNGTVSLSLPFARRRERQRQDPKANTKGLLLIYDELRRAAVASGRAIGPADEAMARQAIRDVLGSDAAGHVGEGADNATDINRMLNAKQTDVLGGEAASYATVVNEMSSWRKDQIDVSLDRGREYEYAP